MDRGEMVPARAPPIGVSSDLRSGVPDDATRRAEHWSAGWMLVSQRTSQKLSRLRILLSRGRVASPVGRF
jgi:hypothetical protein